MRQLLPLALLYAAAPRLHSQTFLTLHSFDKTDGAAPAAALILGKDGNFYGTTFLGGLTGYGTVFEITSSGALTTLHSFCPQGGGCTDGAYPEGLVQAEDGDFYGTTFQGGVNALGNVFKITPTGVVTTLYSFCSQNSCQDGDLPTAGLVLAGNGNFYGTTHAGGASGSGTVFEISPSGVFTTLHSFGAVAGEGIDPFSGLVQGSDGNFYGTAYFGGDRGAGSVYSVSPSGALTTLYSFCSLGVPCADGSNPWAGLVQGSDGNFYGATQGGGTTGSGTIFRVTPGGTLTTLYSFCAQGVSACTDGAGLASGATLIQGSDGNFYGTSQVGGLSPISQDTIADGGTVFRITPSGVLTTIYSFCSRSACADGSYPSAGLVQSANGDLYGATGYGGDSGFGTVFGLSAGLGPVFAPAVNGGGILNAASYTTQGVAPGAVVSIFGANLADSTVGASGIPLPTALSDVTSVTLNNIPAGLYFVSPLQINAQVPFDVLPADQESGVVNIVVSRSDGTSIPQSVRVVPASPGIFTTTANGLGQAFAYDNTTGALAAPAGPNVGVFETAPISASSGHALVIACTGLGGVSPAIGDYVAASDGTFRYTVLQPAVLIGGIQAKLIYSVLSPQFVSEYQVAVVPAANTPTGDAVPLQIQIGGVTTTEQATIAVAP
jgi:uncharacterized protein (TIGR03437 family)